MNNVLNQNTYQRQLSPFGARVLAGGIGLVIAISGLIFMVVTVAAAQLILVVTLLMVLAAVIRYYRSGKIELDSGVSGFFSGWAIGGALAGWLLLLPRSWRLPPAWLSRIFDRNDIEMIRLFHLDQVLLVELIAVLLLIRVTLHRAPEEYWNTGEDIGRGLGAHLAFFGLFSMLWSIFISGPAINLVTLNDHRPAPPAPIQCRYWADERSRNPDLPENPPLSGSEWRCPEHAYSDPFNRYFNRCHRGRDYGPLISVVFVMGSLPALILGAGLIRRGTSLRRLREQIDNLPTARCRSVAAGLAELRGTAMPLNAGDELILNYSSETPDQNRLQAFLLTDETGSVVVELPALEHPDSDERIDLRRHGRRQGPLVEWRLRQKDEIYVLGDFVPHIRQDDTFGRIRPWSPPEQSLLVDLTQPLLEEAMAIGGGWSLARLFGLGRLNGIFILSDAGETGIRRYLSGRWKQQIAAGVIIIVGGLGLILNA